MQNLNVFYHISVPESVVMNNQLILSFKIPLVVLGRYNLFKFTPMPYQIRGDIFGYRITEEEHIIFEENRDMYLTITTKSLENCMHLDDGLLICKETSPIFNADRDTQKCEVNLIKSGKISSKCEIKLVNMTHELWIKVREENTYIFVVPHEIQIYMGCRKKILINPF